MSLNVIQPVSAEFLIEAPADTSSPVVIVLTAMPTVAGGTNSVVTIEAQADDEALASYLLTLTNQNNEVVKIVTDTVVGTTALIETSYDVAMLASGTYKVSLTATDVAGNVSKPILTEITVDNTGPDVAITGSDVLIEGGSTTPTVAVATPEDDLTYLWVTGSENPATGIIDSATIMQPTFRPTVVGVYRFSLTTTDALGNFTLTALSFQYLINLLTIPLPILPTEIELLPAITLPETISEIVESRTVAQQARIESNEEKTAEVLGNTIQPGDTIAIVTPNLSGSPIEPSNGGWVVFGIYWYWWAGIVAIAVFVGLMIKKLMFHTSTRFM